MTTFVFKVRHPSFDPPEGVLEVTAPDYLEAVKALAIKCPGIEVVGLEFEYDPTKIATA